VTACPRADGVELLDGFKRWAAAGQLGWATLSVRVLELDERAAKAAIVGLNSVGRRPQELEEAWLVQALVREDGLSQLEAAALLGRHKSWVCRRLALLERLSSEAQAELRLGVLSVGLARQLTRLPVGNQAAVLVATRRASLTVTEVQGVINLLRDATPEQEALLLQDPRAALLQAAGVPGPVRDPRLSPAGNRLARQLGLLLDLLSRLENWQRHPGLAELKRDDRRLLAPRFARLSRDARSVANLLDEVWSVPVAEACP
jgi:ParB-like chromosome segregation protein Spo0J